MEVSATVHINAPRQDVWSIITDIDNAAGRISAIESLEVLERPAHGIVGLEWTETRLMFGKSASETMWITAAEEGRYYETEARNHSAVYRSRLDVTDSGEGTELTMSFAGEAQSLVAKLMSALMTPFMKGSMQKAIQKDLDDIKAFAQAS